VLARRRNSNTVCTWCRMVSRHGVLVDERSVPDVDDLHIPRALNRERLCIVAVEGPARRDAASTAIVARAHHVCRTETMISDQAIHLTDL